MAKARLDKLIADSGLYSRSEAKALLRAGRVTVNGASAASPEEKYDAGAVICVDGQRLNCARFRYIMLHKPAGVLSATEDRDQETVLDLLPKDLRRLGLFPVGRLDKDVTGLLLLTNDGEAAHRLTAPKKHVPKRYRAAVDGALDDSDIAAFRGGIVLPDGTECLPAELEIAADDASVGFVTVYEGKYHQVKRMFAVRGKPVTALRRERMGALVLDSTLAPGEWRELTEAELRLLL